MIDDLFTELAVGAVDRLLSPETARDEADFGLARLNARLSVPSRREDEKPENRWPVGFDPELEPRLLNHHLQLSVDDLQQVSPRVHEWLLDRLSHSRRPLNADTAATLSTIYFLFPETTVRHAVIGLLIQADRQERWSSDAQVRPMVAKISHAIDQDAGISPEDAVDQMRLFADYLVDYVDVFPSEVERALVALDAGHREGTLRVHFLDWSNRLGGELGLLVQRATERPPGRRG